MIASLCAYLGGEKLGKGTDRTSDVAVVTSSRASQNSTLRASSLLRIDGVGEVSREGPAPVPAGEAGGILDPRGMPTAAANRRRAGGDGARVRREGRRNPRAPGRPKEPARAGENGVGEVLREGPAPVAAGEADGAADGRRAGGGGGIHARWGSSGGSFARWGGQRRPEAPACAGVERDSRAGEDLGDERGRHQRCLVRSATTGGPQRWWLRSASRSKRASGETRRA
jgi:hypothetical protein